MNLKTAGYSALYPPNISHGPPYQTAVPGKQQS
jgi:hypothetical protein